MQLTLSAQLFSLFSTTIEARSGVHYQPDDLELVRDRLSGRAIELGYDSLLDYYYFLRYDADGPRELDALIERLLVHETYFFREFSPLSVLARTAIAPVVAARQRARVWCAASSTGEEPLSLAMLLDDLNILDGVEIIASDFSSQALKKAQLGAFGARAIRGTTPPMFAKWATRREQRAAVDPSLIAKISWRQINLMDASAIAKLGVFDAILCRNVLIYFKDDTVRTVVATLASALKPKGRLLVGVSESLLRFGTQLACKEIDGTFFYERVG